MHHYVGGRGKIGINTPKCPSSRLLPSLFFPPFPVLFSLLLFSPMSFSFPPSFFTVPIPLSSFPLSLFPLLTFPLFSFPLSLPHLFPVFQGWAPAEPQSGPAPPMMDPGFHPFVFRVQTGGNWENWGLYTASRSQTSSITGEIRVLWNFIVFKGQVRGKQQSLRVGGDFPQVWGGSLPASHPNTSQEFFPCPRQIVPKYPMVFIPPGIPCFLLNNKILSKFVFSFFVFH